jgi:surface antigen Omp85-like protein
MPYRYIFITAFIILCLISSAFGQEKYRSYNVIDNYDSFLMITVNENTTVFSFSDEIKTDPVVIRTSDASEINDTVFVMKEPFICREGFLIGDQLFPFSDIDRVRVHVDQEAGIKIDFLTKSPEKKKIRRKHRNRISSIDQMNIGQEQFIRGGVVGFWSDIYIDGEINEDVVAVFGNIEVGENAVIRGDVVAVNGRVKGDGKATIYGVLMSSSDSKKSFFKNWQKWGRHDQYVSMIGNFYYNRVDGAAPYLGIRFIDEDSLLPTTTVYGGYAFASERWRYHIGLEQTFFKTSPLTIGASAYQRLASPDERNILESENTTFALLATEDYKDYYETRGFFGFIRWTPFRGNSYQLGFRSEKQRWLNAYPNLWSLLGGSKRFNYNFHGLGENARIIGISDIDDKDLTVLEAEITLETKDPEDYLKHSFWGCYAGFEWSPDDWSGDYDFTRYLAELCRYQKLNRYFGLLIKATYGTSDGIIPAHRTFFLGGMGNLYGYREKEFSGAEFWLGDLEYHISFPNTEMDGWLFYNVGRITDDPGNWEDKEIKHSLGIGLSIGNDIRMNIAQRLDRSGSSPRLNIRIGRIF